MCLEAATPLGFTGLLKAADAGSTVLERDIGPYWGLLLEFSDIGNPLASSTRKTPVHIRHLGLTYSTKGWPEPEWTSAVTRASHNGR